MRFTIIGMIAWFGIALSHAGSQFEQYRAEFYDAAKAHNFEVPEVLIEFGEPTYNPGLNLKTAAECERSTWNRRTARIVVNESEWVKLTPNRQRMLIYHELGHCALGLRHTESGIMAPENTERPFSIEELFN